MSRGRHDKRIEGTRESTPILFILCEGSETEPDYFGQFMDRDYNLHIATYTSKQKDPSHIISNAQKIIKDNGLNVSNSDKLWCVFDKDANTKDQIDTARSKCNSVLFVAITNPCFELWYLWHFQHMDVGMSCRDVIEKLKTHVSDYEKNEPINDLLLPNVKDAIKRAKLCEKKHTPFHPATSCPTSQVYEIIEYLESKKKT